MSSGSTDNSETATELSGSSESSSTEVSCNGESSRLPVPSIRVSHVRGNIAISPGGNAKIRAKGGGKQKLPDDFPPTGSSNLNKDYCRKSYFKVHCEETEKNWFPRPKKEILRKKRIEKYHWSIKSVLQNLDQFIDELDISCGVCKEQREDFILLTIFPRLQQSWGQCSNGEVYKILAKISCSRNSDIVVRQALQMLHHLLFQDNFGGDSGNLPNVENILRSSILPPEGMFGKDQHCSERDLKLNVYRHILSLQLLQKVLQPESPTLDLGQGLKMFQEKIARVCKEIKNRNSDDFRYSMEFIIETISYLLKTPKELETSKLRSFLQESQDYLKDPKKDSKDLQVLKELQKGKISKMFANTKWIYVHYILIHLHGKVHSERPKPQMETERQAIKLIRLIIENYLKGGGGDDWRFCLLISSILVDITKNNSTEEIMLEAGCCLVNLLKDAKAQKTSKCRVLLERSLSEVLFCPDAKVRTMLIHFMSRNKEKPLGADLHTEHLASIYRNQTLKIDNTTIFQSSNGFINRGMFQRRKVAVKILTVTLQHLLEEDPMFHARARLIRESCNMSQLKHPNFPVLLGYDTKSLPYHLITEYERYRDMLQCVRNSRTTKSRLQPIHLFKLLIGITDALLHLEKLGFVHRAVMAENVLVGDDYVAKLSGLHALKQLRKGLSRQAAAASSDYAYSYSDSGTLEYVSPSTDEDLPARWKAPESLKEHSYSTASDVWALGVLVYEVLTYGCIPYRNLSDDEEVISLVTKGRTNVLPPERCFQQEEYELIVHMCTRQIGRRPKLAKVKKRLSELLQDAEQEESRPEPPFLDIHLKKERSVSSLVLEEIARGDIQHLRMLVRLNNPNLVSVRRKHHENTNCLIVEALLPANSFGNLKDFVLDGRCQVDHVVTYLSQVSSALHYLHKNHIVHGDLRAEYVYVVAQEKVQVGGLGHSKTLSMTANETTSKSCVVEDEVAPHAARWSAPEVILGRRFSHASDVWAYGILSWEVYQSFNFDQDSREMSVPYYNLQTDDEILYHMREEGPLGQPEHCPKWVYNVLHQCWTYESEQRPPFLAIFDCLTSSEPMKSWIMKLWMQNHDEGEGPDVSVRQPIGACHVTEAVKHPSEEDITKMCSEAFFVKHNYRYVDSLLSNDDCYASCSSGSTLDENETLDQNLGYHEPYSGRSLDRNRSRLSPKASSSPSRRKDDRTGKVDLPEPHLANNNTALNSTLRCKAPLPCNEPSLEMEEFYESIPEPTSDTRRLSTPLDRETLGNTSCRAGCHDTDENVADPLLYSSANVSEFKGSIDTKSYTYHENMNTPCASVKRKEASAYSYAGEKEEENSEATLNQSGYLQPVDHRSDDSNGSEYFVSDSAGCTLGINQHVGSNTTYDTLHYNSADVVGFEKPRNQIQQHSGRRDDQSGKVDLPEPQLANNDNIGFETQIMSGREASLPCNNEGPFEIEGTYDYIPEPTADTRLLSTQLNEEALDNASWEGGYNASNRSVSDPLFYSSANVSEFKGSTDTKSYTCHENMNTPCASVKRKEASAHSYPGEKEEENSEAILKESGYFQPIEHRSDDRNDTESFVSDAAGFTRALTRDVHSNTTGDTLHYNSADVVGFTRRRNHINQSRNFSETRNDVPYLSLNPEKTFLVRYQTLDLSRESHKSSRFEDQAHLNENETEFNQGEDDSSLYDDVIGCISKGTQFFERFCSDDGQSVAYQSDEDDSSAYDDVVGFITEDNTRFEAFESKDIGRDSDYHKDVDTSLSNNVAVGLKPTENTHHFEYQNITYDLVENITTRHVAKKVGLGKSFDNTCLDEYQKPTRKLELSLTTPYPYGEANKEGSMAVLGSDRRRKNKSHGEQKENVCGSGASALHHVPQPVEYEDGDMYRNNAARHSHKTANRHQEHILQEHHASTISTKKHSRVRTPDLSDPNLKVIYW